MTTLRELALLASDVGVIPMSKRSALEPFTPRDVLEEFVSAHGAKDEFLEQYGNLQLESLSWRRQSLQASSIAEASVVSDFAAWRDSVARRASGAVEDDWTGLT